MSNDESASIAVVGSYNHDMSVTVPGIPVPGETVMGKDFEQNAGGKGSNQAIAAARSGGEVAFIGAVGDDRFGEFARELWDEEGIDCSDVVTADSSTGVALIHVEEGGENAIAVAQGANHELNGADVREAAATIGGADVLLTQLETTIDSVRAAATVADEAETEVILDPAPAQELPDELMAAVDVATPNESEVRMLAGHDPDAAIDEERAARDVLDRGPDAVVVTLGADGALVVTDGESTTVSPIEAEVADTTGAGDAFNGAFAVARGEGRGIVEAAERGVAAGAAACTERGAVPSLPSRSAIDSYLD
ncbi:ribokinase [Natronomonas halophila]|uniref:ribokinase n=1 Tax=Natronomonas halophila TaxID=2747817 RepID=UPI0015B3BBC4|nr:ribokinase [Natronomonas halophila]QLD85007.1 ribokinase [Natronomonas halophila]